MNVWTAPGKTPAVPGHDLPARLGELVGHAPAVAIAPADEAAQSVAGKG